MAELSGLSLDKFSATPLYEQLRVYFLEEIKAGNLKVGTKLPTEEELCTKLGISRPVVRQAYNSLIGDGYVERLRGKGTFVRASNSHGYFIDKQLSFATSMKILGIEHHTEVLRQEWVVDDPEVMEKLGSAKGERFFHVVRGRYAAGQPYILLENYIPESVFPGIDQYDLSKNSLYDIFKENYNVRIIRSRRMIEAQGANAETAELFRIREGAPVLYYENIVYDQMDRIIDFSKEYMDGATQKVEYEVVNQ